MWSFSETLHRCLVARLSCNKIKHALSSEMTHKCRGMLYCSIYSRENHGRSMILSFPASELAIKSTWNQPQQLPEFLGYAPGHVGRSSCPAGPLEEALRGVLAIAFLDPLLCCTEIGCGFWMSDPEFGDMDMWFLAKVDVSGLCHRHFET